MYKDYLSEKSVAAVAEKGATHGDNTARQEECYPRL